MDAAWLFLVLIFTEIKKLIENFKNTAYLQDRIFYLMCTSVYSSVHWLEALSLFGHTEMAGFNFVPKLRLKRSSTSNGKILL